MPREMTFAEYLQGKVGLFKAIKVASFVVAWGIYIEAVDGVHTLDGYSEYWKQSRATTYRERDLFRICFPEDKVPDRVWGLCREVYSPKLSRDQMGARLLGLLGVKV